MLEWETIKIWIPCRCCSLCKT